MKNITLFLLVFTLTVPNIPQESSCLKIDNLHTVDRRHNVESERV